MEHYIFIKLYRLGISINVASTYRILVTRMWEAIHYIFLKMQRMVTSINEAPWPEEKTKKEE